MCSINLRAWPSVYDLTCVMLRETQLLPCQVCLFADVAARQHKDILTSLSASSQSPLEAWLSVYIDACACALVSVALTDFVTSQTSSSASREPDMYNGEVVGALNVYSTSACSLVNSGGPSESLHIDVLQAMIPETSWGKNAGKRAKIIYNLTGIEVEEISRKDVSRTGSLLSASHRERDRSSLEAVTVDIPWWLDITTLFRGGFQATCQWVGEPAMSLHALEQVWVSLGGPGLLWTIGTERRAMARAALSLRRGCLPGLQKDLCITVRPRNDLQLLHMNVLDLRDTVLGTSAYGPPPGPCVTISRVVPPMLLLSSMNGCLQHADVRRFSQRVVPNSPHASSSRDNATPSIAGAALSRALQAVKPPAISMSKISQSATPITAGAAFRQLLGLGSWCTAQGSAQGFPASCFNAHCDSSSICSASCLFPC